MIHPRNHIQEPEKQQRIIDSEYETLGTTVFNIDRNLIDLEQKISRIM